MGSTTEQPYIRCKTCRLASCNPNDIAQRYCARCCKFHQSADEYELGTTAARPARGEVQ